MTIWVTRVLSVFILTTTLASADVNIREQPIQFEKGKSSATVKGKIKGDLIIDYQLRASAGQSMDVTFKPNNLSAYFNILPPGSVEALFVGSMSGNHFESALPADGVYTIRVYLMRNAARRNETAEYSLEVGITGSGKTPAPDKENSAIPNFGFNKTLSLQGIQFQLICANLGSINTLQIVPSGLEIDNSPIVRDVDGTVTGAEVADLNADGSPEIYVYITSAGSGGYGSLVAYSANQRKSLSEIYLPPIMENKVASKGYMGHDEFAVLEGVLGHRFPVYRAGDSNAKPTGGMRQLQYQLIPGEAGWVLKVDKVMEY